MFYFTWKKGFYISYLFSRWFLVFSKLFLLKTLLWFGPFASTRPSLTPLFPSCHSRLPSLPLQQTTCPPVSHLPSTCQSPTAGPIPATPYKAPFATLGAQGWSCSGAFQGGEKRAERQFRNLIERSFWGLKLQQFRNPWAEAAAKGRRAEKVCRAERNVPNGCSETVHGRYRKRRFCGWSCNSFAILGAKGWSCSGAFQGGEERRAERQCRNRIERMFWGWGCNSFATLGRSCNSFATFVAQRAEAASERFRAGRSVPNGSFETV